MNLKYSEKLTELSVFQLTDLIERYNEKHSQKMQLQKLTKIELVNLLLSKLKPIQQKDKRRKQLMEFNRIIF